MEQPSWSLHYNTVLKQILTPADTLAFALEELGKEHIAPGQKRAIDLVFFIYNMIDRQAGEIAWYNARYCSNPVLPYIPWQKCFQGAGRLLLRSG